MRSCKKLLLVVVGLMILILVGVLGESVYAETNTSEVDGVGNGNSVSSNKKCKYISFSVGDQKGYSNSLCVEDKGDDGVWLSSEGELMPIDVGNGRKLFVGLVGQNTEENIIKGANNSAIPQSDQIGAMDVKEDISAGGIMLAVRYSDDTDWTYVKGYYQPWDTDLKLEELVKFVDENYLGRLGEIMKEEGVEITDTTVDESEPGSRDDDEKTDYSDADSDDCYDNSGALGWILCPIINGISNLGNWLWGEVETNFMQIRVGDFFQGDGGKGVEQAWSTFRDIANVIFIILFMFVIFSQLTGIGIDNYGIKKIMPKLIVVAILINLSYVICLLAVDLSNILGTGLNALFTSIADGITVPIEEITPGQSLISYGLGGGAVAGGILFSLLTNPLAGFAIGAALGLTVLGVVIAIVVSVAFLYIILVIRYAGVIILIAIAPLAIVCYMLPNTEKISKRWLDLLKALLLVYPICGALVGAGKLVGNILASTQNETMVVAGMIVGVLPFFLIPTLLKRSLALAGNIGARLSSVGRSLGQKGSSTAKGAIQNTRGFKDWSQLRQRQVEKGRAEKTLAKLDKIQKRGGTLSQKQQDKLRRAQDVVLAERKTERENKIRTQDGYADAMMYKQDIATDAEAAAIARLNDPVAQQAERQALAEENRLKQDKARTALMLNNTRGEGLDQLMTRWNTAFDSGNAEDLSAITNVINQRYGSSGASSIANSLNTKHNIANNQNFQTSMRTLQQTMNDNTSFAGNMKTKSPDAFQMIGDAGMRFDQTANGGAGAMVQEDMSYFTEHNQTATKVSDWANVSGATLQRAIDSGENAISSDMIERLLNSEDPSVVSGLQSEQGKREALEAALYNRQHNPTGMGPNPDNATASANYRAETANRQNDNDLMIAHEQDARGRGKTNVNIPASVINGTPATTIQGYAVPAGLRTNNGTWTRNADGDHIYTGQGGRQWNVSTGRYVRNNGGNGAP